jgi:hypothetical protein
MMAPDSQSVMLSLLGSVMAGTRPLGLTDSKGSVGGGVVLGFAISLPLGLPRHVFRDLGEAREGLRPTLVQNAEVHELGLVGDVQLVEDDGDFPWVGSL